MKSEWIKREGNATLVLFFGGFGCDKNLLSNSCMPDDCDILMFSDYRSLDFDFDFKNYSRTAVVAWSFGVWVADFFADKIEKPFLKIAINGSRRPVDDNLGIPTEIFEKTLAGFDDRARERFFRRICGGALDYENMRSLLSERSAEALRAELAALKDAFARRAQNPSAVWDAAFASRNDKIFPIENLKREWGEFLRIDEGEHLNLPVIGSAFSIVSKRASKVKSAFEKTIESYNRSGFVQREISETLAEIFDQFTPRSPKIEKILEVGCGTGFLTRSLAMRFNDSKWFLNDLSEKICRCAARAGVVHSTICGGDIMTAKIPGEMDLVVSASCFQWIENLPALFKKLSDISSSNALLAFSTFGQSNYRQIRDVAGAGLKYRNMAQIKSVLEDGGYGVLYAAEDIIDVSFESPAEVLRHMKDTGVNGSFSRFWTPSALKNFSKLYAEKFSDGKNVVLTYNPIYFVAQKKS